MTGFLRIALLFRLSPGYNEGVLRGISAYARPTQPWLFQILDTMDARGIAAYAPHGAITSLLDAASGQAVRALDLPTVNVGIHEHAPGMPSVGNDDGRIGELAAEHLLARGFTSYAFFAGRATPTAKRREAGFRRGLASAEHTYAANFGDQPDAWLRALPARTALFACNDHDGAGILERCRNLGLQVPERLAVVGVDNVESLCLLAYPPLSSVAVAAERIGFEAARTLDLLLQGRRVPRLHAVPPLGVIPRRSSDLVAAEDPHVAAALRFIAEHAGRPIGVEDLLRAVPIARRTLEVRFRALLGRSLLGEIRRVRVERARHLLTTTDLAMPAVARAAGFGDAKQFAAVFGQAEGLTPLRFRRRHRPG
jgi:LacI family transcriptional regulator